MPRNPNIFSRLPHPIPPPINSCCGSIFPCHGCTFDVQCHDLRFCRHCSRNRCHGGVFLRVVDVGNDCNEEPRWVHLSLDEIRRHLPCRSRSPRTWRKPEVAASHGVAPKMANGGAHEAAMPMSCRQTTVGRDIPRRGDGKTRVEL